MELCLDRFGFLQLKALFSTRYSLHSSKEKDSALLLTFQGLPGAGGAVLFLCTNLVDPASSHMLVSKIKPCMSQYKLLHGETANGSLKQLSFIWWSFLTWITMEILELIHAPKPNFAEGL